MQGSKIANQLLTVNLATGNLINGRTNPEAINQRVVLIGKAMT
jgi:hypothetical protein